MKLTKIRWTKNSIRNLNSLHRYLAEQTNEEVMESEAQHIWDDYQRSKQFLESVRPDRVPMTRVVII